MMLESGIPGREPRAGARRRKVFYVMPALIWLPFVFATHWGHRRVEQVLAQKKAVQCVRESGGLVCYQYQSHLHSFRLWEGGTIQLWGFSRNSFQVAFEDPYEYPGDSPFFQMDGSRSWLSPERKLLGVDAFDHVIMVRLEGPRVDGEVWRSLGGLADLQALDLSGMEAGTIQLQSLAESPSARKLAWLRVRLSVGKDDLEHLSAFSNLRLLSISGSVTDADLKDLDRLTKLERLFLPNREIGEATLARIGKLTNLNTLDLGGVKVTDEGVGHLEKLVRLRNLNLLSGRLSDASLVIIGKLPHLVNLAVAGEHITDAGLVSLADLRDLRSLDLNATRVRGSGLRHLKSLPKLESLSLTVESLDAEAFVHMKAFPQLKKLFLCEIRFSEAGWEALGQLTHLTHLNLFRTGIDDDALAHLKDMTNLEALNLYDTDVTDAGLVHLAKLEKLRHLDLADTSVSDAGMRHLTKLKELRKLYLGNTRVSDGGLHHLKQLTKLETLDLPGTQVTGRGVADLEKNWPSPPPFPGARRIYIRHDEE
ncbi:MAG: hypothetical protein HQ581_01690 [Planctomycetes bacterium]|nr:hypothetical protein [Planctomycetota bacterium]